jgi:hypothetical protein
MLNALDDKVVDGYAQWALDRAGTGADLNELKREAFGEDWIIFEAH